MEPHNYDQWDHSVHMSNDPGGESSSSVSHGTPIVGQLFDSIDEAYQFYLQYAKRVGFGVRMNSSRKVGDELVRKEFVCSKEGVRRNNNAEKVRRVGKTRENCFAKLSVVKARNKYRVAVFVEEHSHPLLSPSKVEFLRAHRGVSDVKRAITIELDAANVPLHQQMTFFGITAGGLENVGCTETNLRNVRKDNRKLVDGRDADLLKEYFVEEQEKNPSFYYSIMVDDENKLSGCFWADAASRRAYHTFGDVVVFDTTHGANRYDMVFAHLLGVNNHAQTILFGCAFLRKENIEHFRWLFDEFMKAMSGGPPKVIITDQDAVMANVIPQVFPNTLHRFCIWHINKKWSEKLGHQVWAKFGDNFLACIWKSTNPQEFESWWMQLLADTGLHNHPWLLSLYAIRSQWVPAFVKDLFVAGMSTSQRAESNHAFFKKFVNPNHTFMDFILRFDRAHARIRHTALKNDHKDTYEHPSLSANPHPIEVQFATIYTRAIFNLIQKQLNVTKDYRVELKDNANENFTGYLCENPWNRSERPVELVEDFIEDEVRCSCKMFEWEGIPCTHLLNFFIYNKKLIYVPEKYILRRWCKTIKDVRAVDENGVELHEQMCDSSFVARRVQLYQQFDNVVDEAISVDHGQELEDLLYTHRFKLLSIKGNSDGVVQSTSSVNPCFSPTLLVPDKRNAKDSEKRFKSSKEMATTHKKRKCGHCGYVAPPGEKGHTARYCPQKVLPNVEEY